MKIVGISIVRTASELNDPIPLTMACDLASFGFFQRQVGVQSLHCFPILACTSWFVIGICSSSNFFLFPQEIDFCLTYT